MVDVFSGDVSSTTLGFLRNSTPGGVQVRDTQGLTIANDAGTQSVVLSCTAASTLSVSGAMSLANIKVNSITTRNPVSLTLTSSGAGCIVPHGKHLALGGDPASPFVLDVVSSPGGAEHLTRWSVADCNDSLEISNLSSVNGVFIPSIKATQSRAAAQCALEICAYSLLDSTGDTCSVSFLAQTSSGTPLVTQTLFRWSNGRGPRQTTSKMELVPSRVNPGATEQCDLVLPNALNPAVRMSGLDGKIECRSLDISGDPDFDLLSVRIEDRNLLGLRSTGMTIGAGQLVVADVNVDGDPDFDLLRVGNTLPSPGHTTLTVARSGAVSHGSLQISGDPDFDLLRVSPRDASAILSIGSQGCDFHFHQSSNFVLENVQTPSSSTAGRLVWDSLRDLALVDTGTELKKIGPDTMDQVELTLEDSNVVSGGNSGIIEPVSFDKKSVISPDQFVPGTKYSLCVDGSCSRASASTMRIVVTLGPVTVYDDTCKPFSLTGGAIFDAPWSIEVDIVCRSAGQEGQFVSYGECMVPFERGDIPTQENRVASYDLKACKRTFSLDCTTSHQLVVSVEWGDGSTQQDQAMIATYDLAQAKK